MEELYKTKLATVRESTIEDAHRLSKTMREADKKEIWNAYHREPLEALISGFNKSIKCFTVERNNEIIAMFGVVTNSILGNKATIWMLASDEIEKIPKTFVRHSKHFINMILQSYPNLMNFVDIDNKVSLKWLKWCGFTIEKPQPYGIERTLFSYFHITRSNQ